MKTLQKITGPIDGALLVALITYGVGFYAAKWLHQAVMSKALLAEAEWIRVSSAAAWGEG